MSFISNISLKNRFFLTIFFTIFLRSILAIIVPITTDEAYFVTWAENLDYGYFDHPPVTGWVIHVAMLLGKNSFIVRLPAIISSLLIGLGIYSLLKEYDQKKAWIISILFLLSPAYLFNGFITTNTPLEVFSFFSGFFLFKALKKDAMKFYALSGLFLGLALMTKYLVVFNGFAYVVYLLVRKRNKEKYFGFALLFLMTIPFLAVHLYWNYMHCWNTVNHHLFTRHPDSHYSVINPFLYLVTLLYLVSPPALYYIAKNKITASVRIKDRNFEIFFFSFLVPIGIFSFFALKVLIGLHWLMGYVPFFFLLMYLFLKEEQLLVTLKFNLLFSFLHLVALLGFLYSPLSYWKQFGFYEQMVFWKHTDKVMKVIEPYKDKFHLAAYGYAAASIASFSLDRYFSLFAYEGFIVRQDDEITDFRKLNGKNILVLIGEKKDADSYLEFFDRIEVKTIRIFDAELYYVLGYGFKFEPYKRLHLTKVLEKYYNFPEFLPVGSCKFKEDYFGESSANNPIKENNKIKGFLP